jgi:hypothetical protein
LLDKQNQQKKIRTLYVNRTNSSQQTSEEAFQRKYMPVLLLQNNTCFFPT